MGARARPARVCVAGPAGRARPHRDAEDVRPAPARARGSSPRRRSAPRQVAPLPHRRRRAAAARPPDERRPAAASGAWRERAEDARVPAPLRERRRARPHRGGEEEARGRLARDARAVGDGTGASGAGGARARRRPAAGGARGRQPPLHSLLRDQRALTGIGRAHANEILHRAQLSPFALSSKLGDEEIDRLAEAIEEDLARALELREHGKGDKDVYLVHRRLGEPCPRCGDALRQVDYEEHTVFYCAPCQTGGRILKDRRMSRLLR